MVDVIPIEDPLGPANITLLLDDCPLPTKVIRYFALNLNSIIGDYLNKHIRNDLILSIILNLQETIAKLIDLLKLDTHLDPTQKASMNENYHRNIAIVLGCIAEKLAGPRSIALFTSSTLDYLVSNLVCSSFK